MSKVGRSADANAVKMDAAKAQREADIPTRDMQGVMAHPSGRRLLTHILRLCGSVGNREPAPLGVDGKLNETFVAIREGKKVVGVALLELMALANHGTMVEISSDVLSLEYPAPPSKRGDDDEDRIVEADDTDGS